MKKQNRFKKLKRYSLTLPDIIRIVLDVYETSALKDEGRFSADDVCMALERIKKGAIQ